jgi:short-subunit dehydrogenase
MEANKIIITGAATRIGAAIAKKFLVQEKKLLFITINLKLKLKNLKKN